MHHNASMHAAKLARTVAAAVSALTLLAASFVGGAAVGANRHWFGDSARLVVRNDSGQPIRSLEIAYESARASGTIRSTDIQAAGERHYDLDVGEGSFMVVATLANGTVLRGRGQYVESEWSASAVVRPSRIDEQAKS